MVVKFHGFSENSNLFGEVPNNDLEFRIDIMLIIPLELESRLPLSLQCNERIVHEKELSVGCKELWEDFWNF